MDDTAPKPLAASENFIVAISRFTQDLETIYKTLPSIMNLMKVSFENKDKTYSDFLRKYGTNPKPNPNGSTTYTIEPKHVAHWQKLKQERENAQSAMRLIPRNLFTSIVSQFDSFLASVIRFIFETKPEILNASERTISYIDLNNFVDISSAREYIIEKEIESVLRKSHSEQFEWLEKKMGTPFNKGLKSWPNFIEITERRNLFVHTDGKVSTQYFKVCKDHGYTIDPNLKVGMELEVTPSYFYDAYKCVFEIGFKLAHVVWRRLEKQTLEQSDNNITRVTLDLIDKNEYELAARILDFFTEPHIRYSNDNARRVLLINKAQTYKWMKNEDMCRRILESNDWTACETKFKLAVCVLKDEYENAFKNMRFLKHDPNFLSTSYKDWPLFKQFRLLPEFAKVYTECYGEEFALVGTANK